MKLVFVLALQSLVFASTSFAAAQTIASSPARSATTGSVSLPACPSSAITSFSIRADDKQLLSIETAVSAAIDPMVETPAAGARAISAAVEKLKAAGADYDDRNWGVGSAVTLVGGHCNDNNGGTTNNIYLPILSYGISSQSLAGFVKLRTFGPCHDLSGAGKVRVCVLGTTKSISAFQ